MNSRLERRFSQSKADQLVDPFLVSGIDPSLVKKIMEPEVFVTRDSGMPLGERNRGYDEFNRQEFERGSKLLREVVENTIRAQWTQVHPDRANATAGGAGRTDERKRELEKALHQLSSTAFPNLLRQYRSSFSHEKLAPSCAEFLGITEQFQSLDELVQAGSIKLPIFALRDVTVELFDLPALSKTIKTLLSTPLAERKREQFLALMLKDADSVTLTDFSSVQFGEDQHDLENLYFGRTLRRLLHRKLSQSDDPALKEAVAIIFPTGDEFAERDSSATEAGETQLARLVAPLWNEAVHEVSRTPALSRFWKDYETSLSHQELPLFPADLERITQAARDLPTKRIYIDRSGALMDQEGVGYPYSAYPLRDSDFADHTPPSGDERNQQSAPTIGTETPAEKHDRVIKMIAMAASRANSRFKLSAKVPDVHSISIEEPDFERGLLAQRDDATLPGLADLVSDEYFGTYAFTLSTAGGERYTTVPAELLETPDAGLSVDSATYLLTSIRHGKKGSHLSLDGFINKIVRGNQLENH